MLENEIGSMRLDIEKLEMRNVQIDVQVEELDRRISTNENNKRSISLSHEKELQELEENKKNLKLKQATLDQLDKKVNDTKEKIKSCNNEMDDIEAELKKIQERISQEKARSISIEAQIDVLEQAERSLSGFTSGSKALVEAVQKGKLTGHYDLLFSKIQVPAEYERAIASVLGETLEALVLDEKTDPEKALSFLESSESGRTVLLPKAWLQKGIVQDHHSINGAISALDVINVREDFQPIFQVLLKNVFIVKDHKSARQLLKKVSADIKCVTSKGEVFFSNGTVIAGKEVRVKTIARNREKQDLFQKQKDVKKAFEKLEENLREVSIRFEEKCKVKLNLDNISQDLQKENIQLIDTINSENLLLNQKQNKISWQNEQIQSFISQVENNNKEKEKLIKERIEIKQQASEHRKKLDAVIVELNKFPLEELRDELFSCSTNKAIEEQALHTAELHVEEARMRLEEKNQEKDGQKVRLEECVNMILSLIDQKNVCLKKEVEFEEKTIELESKIEPAEQRLKELEINQITLIESQDATRQQFSVAERHNIQAQMKLSRIREQQESLRKRIEEDFGLVYYEYAQTVEGPTPLPIDGMVENLPKLKKIPDDLEENIKQQKSLLRRMGPINPEAQKEFHDVQERYQFITDQLKDLEKAESDLRQVVTELDGLMKTEFEKTFQAVNEVFKTIFKALFGGGSAELIISDMENMTESGIDIHTTLPGKRKQELASLSGGERSLTAVALIFALLKVSPTPFCILDEVDAMLDESNVMRFGELLRDLSETTQFIVITHNRNTVQLANVLYGVTMGKDSTSQVISLKMEELTEDLVQ